MIGGLAENEAIHKALVAFAALVALIGVLQSPASFRAVFTAVAGVGVALLASGAFVEALEAYETPLTVAGALVLVTAHILRWRASGRAAAA